MKLTMAMLIGLSLVGASAFAQAPPTWVNDQAALLRSPDPKLAANPKKKYAGAHFDMFRLEHGKIAEHWDSVPKDPAALHFDPNVDSNKP